MAERKAKEDKGKSRETWCMTDVPNEMFHCRKQRRHFQGYHKSTVFDQTLAISERLQYKTEPRETRRQFPEVHNVSRLYFLSAPHFVFTSSDETDS